MRTTRGFRQLIVALSCAGLLAGQVAQAVELAATPIRDVALQPGGVLHGQVLDQQGMAVPHAPLALLQHGEPKAITRTDAEGRFTWHGVAAGVYQLQASPTDGATLRLWAANTAPPAAQPSVLLVADQEVARGQFGPGVGWGGGGLMSWLMNPWVLAGIVAAAIAIPLALDDDDAS